MPNDERILETMPTGTLGLIPTAIRKKSRQLSVHLERASRTRASQRYCFQGISQRELHHRASYSTIWFRRSEMCYQSVCPGL